MFGTAIKMLRLVLNITLMQLIIQCGNYGIGGGYDGSHIDRNILPEGDSRAWSPKYPGDRLLTAINVLEAPKAGRYCIHLPTVFKLTNNDS